MLTHIHLENFRAFGAATDIPLAPITLLFGENSSGKTSILHALTLLKQTHEADSPCGALVPKGIVDLGSYQEFIHDHDVAKSLTLGFGYDLSNRELASSSARVRSVRARWQGLPVGAFSVRWRFGYDEKSGNSHLAAFLASPTSNGQSFLTLRPSPPSRQDELRWHLNKSELYEIDLESLPSQDYEELSRVWNLHRNAIRSEFERFILRPALARAEKVEKAQQEAQALYESLGADWTSQQLQSFLIAEWTQRVFVRSGLAVQAYRDYNSAALMLKSISLRLSKDPSFKRGLGFTDISTSFSRLEDGVPEAMRALRSLGPFRQAAMRVYSYSGRAPSNVGRTGELLPEFLKQDEFSRAELNQWLKRFDIGYRIRVRPLGGRARSDIFELRLQDLRRKKAVEVAFNDVGFGISQLLPLIVQAVAAKNQIITIEQPEVHIHPRLQAEVGELLAECMQRNGHQFLVETHSEHLILRLRRLVREKRLKPSDLCVLHVARGRNGAEVQRIHVGEDGSFLDEWPGGFFPERLRELS
jgi:hypothetical protein